jgi:hypothetical protein
MKPVLDAVGNKLAIFVTPLPRYVISGCCDDPTHVSNREDRHFRSNMNQQLEGLRRNVKNFLFNTGRRSIRILDTAMVIKGLEDADLWCTDPVHPIESVYGRIAEGVTTLVTKTVSGAGGSGRGRNGGGGGSSGRGGGGGGGSGRDVGSHVSSASGPRWSDGGERGRGRGRFSWRAWQPEREQHGRGSAPGRWNCRGGTWSGHQKRRRDDDDDDEADYEGHRSNQRYMAHGHINRGGRRGRHMQ